MSLIGLLNESLISEINRNIYYMYLYAVEEWKSYRKSYL